MSGRWFDSSRQIFWDNNQQNLTVPGSFKGTSGTFDTFYAPEVYTNTQVVGSAIGANLTAVPSITPGGNWISIAMSASGQYQSAIDQGVIIWLSNDYGITWAVSPGSPSPVDFYKIAISASGQYQSVVAQSDYIYVSSDYGRTWTQVNQSVGTATYYSIDVSASGQYQTAVVFNGYIYISSDYGITWTPTDSQRGWYDVAVSASGQYQTATDANDVGIVYKSSNYGVTWTSVSVNAGLTNRHVVMSATGQYQIVNADNANSIYLSSDYGMSWNPTATALVWIKIAMSASGQYMVAYDYTNIYLWISTDYGSTWNTNSVGIGLTDMAVSAAADYFTTVGYGGTIYTSTTPVILPNIQIGIANISSITIPGLELSSINTNFISSGVITAGNLSTLTANMSSVIITNLRGASTSVSSLTGNILSISSLRGNALFASTASFSTLTGNAVSISSLTGNTVFASSATVSTLTGASLVMSSLRGNTLFASTATVSTFTGNSLSISSLVGNTLFASSATVSTFTGNAVLISSLVANTVFASSATVSTLTGASLVMSSLVGNTLFASSATVSSLTGNALSMSSLVGNTVFASTASFSTLTGNALSMSSLRGNTLFASTATVSTLNGNLLSISSLRGNTLFASSATVSTLSGNIGLFSNLTTSNIFYSWQTTGSFDSFSTDPVSNFNVGSGNFTMECFFYPTAIPASWGTIMSLTGPATGGREFRITQRYGSAGLGFLYPTGATTDGSLSLLATSTLSLSTWCHLALTRSTNWMYLYSNGTAILSTNLVSHAHNENKQIILYRSPYPADTFGQGYINSARVVVGQVLYTGNFIPPTQQLSTNSVGAYAFNVAGSITGTVAFLGGTVSTLTDAGPSALALNVSGSPRSGTTVPTTFTGRIGINCNTPQFGLDVNGGANINGNLFMGRGVNGPILGSGYTYIGVGGGNSWGYMYGAFQSLADGIHLSYNYINCNLGPTGDRRGYIPNVAGGTSQLDLGYSQIDFRTGGINTAPSTLMTLTTAGLTLSGTLTIPSTTTANSSRIDFPATNYSIVCGVSTLGGTNQVANKCQIMTYTGAAVISAFTVGTDRTKLIGINNCNDPQYTLDVNGSTHQSNNLTTWGVTSDRRIKTNIEFANLDICYSSIQALTLRRYEYDSNVFPNREDKHVIGLIAQEVQPIFPKAVTQTSSFGFSDLLGIDYDQLYMANLGATKKLIDVIEQQGSTIQGMQQQLSTLQRI